MLSIDPDTTGLKYGFDPALLGKQAEILTKDRGSSVSHFHTSNTFLLLEIIVTKTKKHTGKTVLFV